VETMNRRDFLARSGRAAAGVAAGLTILKGRAVAQNDTIGVAVAGIHGRGVSHIEAFSRMEGVRVVALCDPDSSLFADRAAIAEKAQGSRPRTYQDIREALDDPEVDAVSIATCNHWHALMTVWACQAGKDVYCEKPVSWSVWEGRKAVEAARKYQRIVAGGHQSRSEKKKRDAIARLWAGQLGGPCYLSRALCFKPRGSIGFKEPKDPPDGFDFDLWLGPAPEQPFHENIVHYNWHWFWDFGNGDLGNQGVHQMDVARWALNRGLPTRVHAQGGRLGYKDQGETPNTLNCTFKYDDGTCLVFDVRGLPTNDEGGVRIGNLFYGPEGWMSEGDGFAPHIGYKGDGQAKEITDLPAVGGNGTEDPFVNFIECVRSRRVEDVNCEIEEAHLSAAMCHIANISYRLGGVELAFDPVRERFTGYMADDANKLLKRKYRKPYVIPDDV